MFGFGTNLIICILIVLVGIFIIYRITKKNYEIADDINENQDSLEYIMKGVKKGFEDLINKDVRDLNLNKRESLKRSRIKLDIQRNLRICSQGNLGSKEFIKEYIQDMLQKQYLNANNIDKVILFEDVDMLSEQDKFEIMMLHYKKKYKYDALNELINKYNLSNAKIEDNEEYYEISKEDINYAFSQEKIILSYADKVQIITQRVYQELYGLGAIDEIRDMKIDGVSGGVSGIPFDFYTYDMEWFDSAKNENLNSYNSIWIFFKGNTYRLAFLGFGTQAELIRVCKNIYKYGRPGQLSEERGYVANEMKDGSRVVTFRPPFSASWAFFVRKYDSIEKKDFKNLITDKGNEMVELIVKMLVKSNQVIILTGEQGSGKTTTLLSLIEFLGKNCNLRIYELIFELYAQKIYPKLNLLNLRETESIFSQKALEIIRKTEATAIMLGEIASYESANWLIEMSQINSKSTMGTNHAATTLDLVNYFRNACIKVGGFSNERIAEEQVISTLNFDIHMVNVKGHRYIERITEIVPGKQSVNNYDLQDPMKAYFQKMITRPFEAVDIIRYENGEYVIKNQLSKRTKEQILSNASSEECRAFNELFNKVVGEIAYE